jgi:hypothetical protein
VKLVSLVEPLDPALVNTQRWFQTVWLAGTAPLLYLMYPVESLRTVLIYGAPWVSLAVGTVLLFRSRTSGVLWSAVPAAIIGCYFGAWTIFNLLAYVVGAELYRDSPATIFVVLIVATPTALPAAAVLLLSWSHWRRDRD